MADGYLHDTTDSMKKRQSHHYPALSRAQYIHPSEMALPSVEITLFDIPPFEKRWKMKIP